MIMRAINIDNRKLNNAVEAGPAPMLQWIKIADLVVDDSYQRGLKADNWKAIQRIASSFKWSRFSTVLVAPIEGGKFAIIDGQHRTHAAALCGIAEVPCQVVQMSAAEQASSFAAVNGAVTAVTQWQIFKAALAAGEDWAVACNTACADAGCALMTSNKTGSERRAGEIFAIRFVRRTVEKGLGDDLTFALANLRRSQRGARPVMWSFEVLEPWVVAVAARPWLRQGAAPLATFIDRFDLWKVVDQATKEAAAARRRGDVGVTRSALAAKAIGAELDAAFPLTAAKSGREAA